MNEIAFGNVDTAMSKLYKKLFEAKPLAPGSAKRQITAPPITVIAEKTCQYVYFVPKNIRAQIIENNTMVWDMRDDI